MRTEEQEPLAIELRNTTTDQAYQFTFTSPDVLVDDERLHTFREEVPALVMGKLLVEGYASREDILDLLPGKGLVVVSKSFKELSGRCVNSMGFSPIVSDIDSSGGQYTMLGYRFKSEAPGIDLAKTNQKKSRKPDSTHLLSPLEKDIVDALKSRQGVGLTAEAIQSLLANKVASSDEVGLVLAELFRKQKRIDGSGLEKLQLIPEGKTGYKVLWRASETPLNPPKSGAMPQRNTQAVMQHIPKDGIKF